MAEMPAVNGRKEVLLLLKALDKSRLRADKETLFRMVFGETPYDDHRLRMAISLAYKMTLKYLAVADFLKDEAALLLRQSEALRHRRLPAMSARALDAAGEALEVQPARNAAYLERRYRLALEAYELDMQLHRADHARLQSLNDQLDAAFLARKLWQSCFLLSHETRSGSAFDYGLLHSVLPDLQHHPALEEPAVAIYYYCYLALTRADEPGYYARFKQELLRAGPQFPESELRDLYILAINFCIRQYNAGNKDFLREQFDLYREGLEQGFFLTDGELSRYTYQNAATLGLVLHELDWVEQFIHGYRDQLPPTLAVGLFSFNLARLEYARKRYGNALQLLQKAEYKDVLVALAAKTLQMKIYFEQDEYDLLESHLQAMKTFLQRKKELGYHRENYLNTIRFVRRILELSPLDRSGRAALQHDIEHAKSLAEQEWLLSKT